MPITRTITRTTALSIIAVLLGGLTLYRLNQYLQPPSVAEQEQAVKVAAITVTPLPLTTWVFAEGTAEALRKAFLNFERAGKVVAIGQDDQQLSLREGSRVTGPEKPGVHGQHLASLDSRTTTATTDSLAARLQSARQQSEEAKANTQRSKNNLQLARAAFGRTEKMFTQGLIAQHALDRDHTALLNAQAAVTAAESAEAASRAAVNSLSAELEGALISLSKDSLYAPFDGLITVINLRQGNHYYPPASATSASDREAASAIVIVDDSRFEISLDVPEPSAALVREGQTIWVSSNSQALYQSAMDGHPRPEVMTGTVWSVSPSLSLKNRSKRIKLRTDGDQPVSLQDGLYVQAWIAARHLPQAVTLPIQALSYRDRQPFIYVIDDHNQVKRREVSTGLQGLTRIEITSNLQPGDTVVVRGQHLLSEGSLVEVIHPGVQP